MTILKKTSHDNKNISRTVTKHPSQKNPNFYQSFKHAYGRGTARKEGEIGGEYGENLVN